MFAIVTSFNTEKQTFVIILRVPTQGAMEDNEYIIFD